MRKCFCAIVIILTALITPLCLGDGNSTRSKRQGLGIALPSREQKKQLASQLFGGIANAAGAFVGSAISNSQGAQKNRPNGQNQGVSQQSFFQPPGRPFQSPGRPFQPPGRPFIFNQQRPAFNQLFQPQPQPAIFPEQQTINQQPAQLVQTARPAVIPTQQTFVATTQQPVFFNQQPAQLVQTARPEITQKPFSQNQQSEKLEGEKYLIQRLNECGSPKVTTTRISGGAEATKGAWPWMAALRYVDGDDNLKTFCGGTLITNRRVLTAAHCLPGPTGYEILKVRLGDHDLESEADDRNVVERFVAKWIKHESYDSKTSANDIGVLILDREVPFTDFVMPVCLPVTPTTKNSNFLNKISYVAGWGAKDFAGLTSNTLQEARIRVYSQAQCKNAYTGIRNTKIDKTVICAGVPSGRQDACQGDSGGPLMTPVGGKFYLIGIVSKGLACGTPNVPGIYTRVTTFMDWITNEIN
ncbi:venom serine protease Bi-VSP-like isoform X2 [Artemia franciscana]|uniref:Peptidase S1 domain-containing protein n=1 Tax=Artemia franciscana TaxID=6661 RepID=A0AA88IH43_ARTSF|nr:hypothetical protein QYM36_003925 [Artemia franciscana]